MNLDSNLFSDREEKEFLGSILIKNSYIEIVESEISADIFYYDLHKSIYKTIINILDKGYTADTQTVYFSLAGTEGFGENSEFHGEKLRKYLEDLISYAVGSLSSPKELAKILHFLFLKRQLFEYSRSITDIIKDSSLLDVELKIDQIEQKIYEISNTSVTSEVKSIHGFAKKLKTKLENARLHKTQIQGLKSDLKDLDRYTNGFNKTDLIIVAARPSMGKTALALTIARNIAKNLQKDLKNKKNIQNRSDAINHQHTDLDLKTGAAFFSLEMSGEQLGARLVAMESGQSTKAIHTGRKGLDNEEISDSDFADIVKAFQSISEIPLFIDETPSLSLTILRSRARYLKRKHNISVIIIDYLQLLRSSKNTFGNRVLEIAEITQGLKAIAKELDIPVIALSQLSRAVESRDDKRPQLSDLRESGTIEQDADIVMFLYREAYYLERSEPKITVSPDSDDYAIQYSAHEKWDKKYRTLKDLGEIIIAKNRNGPVGFAIVHFDREKTEFTNHIPNENIQSFSNNTQNIKRISPNAIRNNDEDSNFLSKEHSDLLNEVDDLQNVSPPTVPWK